MICNFRLSIARAFISCLFLLPASANAQTFETMIDNGPTDNRIDMVFVGDGYKADEIETTYVDHVNAGIDYFFGGIQDPFPRYQNFFNVHRVNVISNESGADQPPSGIFRDTALDASYWWDGITERLLSVNQGKATIAAGTALAGGGIGLEMRIAVVNDSKYGGAGGYWATYAGGNFSATEVALHEIGHSFASLADEYESGEGVYTGPEPSEPNVTATPATPTSPGKWDRWDDYVDPDHPQIGPVGYYEGGYYHEEGIYRPTIDSKMRSLYDPFNAISREAIIAEIYGIVTPLDGFLDNSTALLDPSSVWVETIDPDVINVSWLLDGVLLAQAGELIDLAALDLDPGDYELEAHAYDGILDYSFTGERLDWWRLSDTSPLRQSVSWNFSISVVPEPGGLTLLTLLAAAWPLRRQSRRVAVQQWAKE